jgi:hypothetical protein
MKKKDIRILWNVNKEREINALEVVQFSTPKENIHLYDIYLSEIGNCLIDWAEWTLADVLIKIFIKNKVSEFQRKSIFEELCKVDEWNEEMSKWLT